MDDIFNELVEYEAWDMALQFLSEHQQEFKNGFSNLSEKKKYRLALRLKSLIQHISDSDIRKIYEQEFGNFIYFNIQPKSQYALFLFQEEKEEKDCPICMDTFEYNDLVVCCKKCSHYLGHYNCCDIWYTATHGKNIPDCPNCKQH